MNFIVEQLIEDQFETFCYGTNYMEQIEILCTKYDIKVENSIWRIYETDDDLLST